MIPQGVGPPREPTRLEALARAAGWEPDDLRAYLRFEIEVRREEAEEAWRDEMARVLAEAQAEGQSPAPPEQQRGLVEVNQASSPASRLYQGW